MSNDCCEDSYTGLGFFFWEKVLKCSNNYRCAFIHSNAFMNALGYIYNF